MGHLAGALAGLMVGLVALENRKVSFYIHKTVLKRKYQETLVITTKYTNKKPEHYIVYTISF